MRSWTQFEAYIAMRMPSVRGLTNAPNENRWTAEVPYSTDSTAQMKAALKAEWLVCSVERAHEKLSSQDIDVTNKTDKEIMLPKLLALDEQVRNMMRKRPSMVLGSLGDTLGRLDDQARSMTRTRVGRRGRDSQGSTASLWAHSGSTTSLFDGSSKRLPVGAEELQSAKEREDDLGC